MRISTLTLLLSLTLLASCTWGKSEPAKSPYPSTPLGENTTIVTTPTGSSYTARGVEPFWAVEVTPGKATISRPTETGSLDIAFDTEEDDKGGIVTIRSVKGDMFLNMTRGSCSDGASDTKYLYNATLLVGAETLTGCALKK